MLKLLTGSKLLLPKENNSKDTDYKYLTWEDNPKILKEQGDDIFTINLSKDFAQLSRGDKESVLFFVLTYKVYKILDKELEQEHLYQDYIEEMIPHLSNLLEEFSGVRRAVIKYKWYWWYWLAIKMIRQEDDTITEKELREVFERSYYNKLTPNDYDYVEEYFLSDIIDDPNYLSKPFFKDRIDRYNARHNYPLT